MENLIRNYTFVNYYDGQMKIQKRMQVKLDHLLQKLDLLRAGKSYVESGKYGTTNGSAMKVSPLGILHDYHDIKGLVDDVCKLCLPTHNTSIAIAGASVIATLSSYALRHEYNEGEIWSLAKRAIEEGMKHGNQLPSASLSKRIDLIRQDITTLSEKEVLEKLEIVYGVGFETIETIPAVLAMIILSKGNPMKSAQLSAYILQGIVIRLVLYPLLSVAHFIQNLIV